MVICDHGGGVSASASILDGSLWRKISTKSLQRGFKTEVQL
jgi:hypothetical protein